MLSKIGLSQSDRALDQAFLVAAMKPLYSSPKLCRFFAISRESGRCLA